MPQQILGPDTPDSISSKNSGLIVVVEPLLKNGATAPIIQITPDSSYEWRSFGEHVKMLSLRRFEFDAASLAIVWRAYARQMVAMGGAEGDSELEDAFATVFRERFLGDTPWQMLRPPSDCVRVTDPVLAYQDALWDWFGPDGRAHSELRLLTTERLIHH